MAQGARAALEELAERMLRRLGRRSCAQGHVAGGAVANRVTRDVEPSALRDLIDDPPRATVAFVDRDAVELLPVRVGASRGLQLFGIVAAGGPGPGGGGGGGPV